MAAPSSAEDVVASRKGEVLLKYTILKSDHFPGCQNKTLANQVAGAPNFRQVPDLPVYGCAIPTVAGLRLVLNALGAKNGERQVLWQNMREEPVLYINGRPFVVREADKPFQNLEYTGIDRSRVEDMEARLKSDVLKEAAGYGGQVLTAGEDDDFQVVELWETVTPESVQTPREVYAALADEGYVVDYLRVPVTDEKAPKPEDFGVLIQRAWAPPEQAALVFNCQMGRGRTTTGMIIASLLHLHHRGRIPDTPLPEWYVSAQQQRAAAAASAAQPLTPRPVAPEAELKAGNFGAVRSLLRVLPFGQESKAILDSVIDSCSAMQNLREAIAGYRSRLMHEGHEGKRNALLEVCLEYLERYYSLIAFTAYLNSPAFAPGLPQNRSYGQWLDERPELYSVKERMLRRNPLAAMALHHPSRQLAERMSSSALSLDVAAAAVGDPSAPLVSTLTGADLEDEVQATADRMVAARSGAVLGAHTILKEDHFPGCQSEFVPVVLPGAPNLRAVPGTNVYGVALPTLDGIRGTLRHVGAAPGSRDAHGREVTAVWHNMREEVCIYINGRPYVLREEERPFKNMQEYSGIDYARLQKMESRLRNDVLREAGAMGGRLLVARELIAQGRTLAGGEMEDDFEPVSGPAAVQTPQEVYQQLRQEGYRVAYYRVPLTDGTTPKERDFDEFARHIRAANHEDPLIFNCQLGGGRTTTGTIIGCLLRGYDAAVAAEPVTPEAGRSPSANGGPEGTPFSDFPGFAGLETSFAPGEFTDLPGRLRALSVYSDAHGPGPGNSGALDDDDAVLAAMQSPRSIMSDEVGGASPQATDDEEDPPMLDATGIEDNDTASVKSAATVGSRLAPSYQGPATAGTGDLEEAALKEGEYVAVRRFVRLLERGGDAKAVLDETIDRAGALVNLRTAISRYRKPRRRFRFFRPEIQVRHTAFKRGSAYLERYCLLIAFTAYLDDCRRKGTGPLSATVKGGGGGAGGSGKARGGPTTFEEWMDERPDLCQARDSIIDNPSGALAPVPIYRTPAGVMRRVGSSQAMSQEQRDVLARRSGTVLSHRSILKTSAPRPQQADANALNIAGVSDIRKVRGALIYTVGEATVDGWRRLLTQVGAAMGGAAHAVVADVREETAVYIAGRPYLRRELEMPATALHHAGIRAGQLEKLEAALAADLAAEAPRWGHRLLLHAEPWAYGQPNGQPNGNPSGQPTSHSSGPSHAGQAANSSLQMLVDHVAAGHSSTHAADGGGPSSGGSVSEQAGPSSHQGPERAGGEQGGPGLGTPQKGPGPFLDKVTEPNLPGHATPTQQQRQHGSGSEALHDMSDPPQQQSGVAGGCGSLQAGAPHSLLPPRAPSGLNMQGGQHGGQQGSRFQSSQSKRRWQLAAADTITHKTQESELQEEAALVAFWQAAGAAGDLADGICTPREVFARLAEEGFQVTAERVPLSRERAPEAADLDVLQALHASLPPGKVPVVFFLSRTATGSSVRFASAFVAGLQRWTAPASAPRLDRKVSMEPPASTEFRQPAPAAPLSAADARAFARHRSAGVLGEYRAIMNLCRVLPDGLDCKLAVDEAVDRCNDIGNLRDDILKCKEAAEAAPGAGAEAGPPLGAVSSRGLGQHYLQRYFLLIAFRCYLGANPVQGPDVPTFAKWFADRGELRFLLSTLSLDTAL